MLIILVDLEDVAETPDDENSQAKKKLVFKIEGYCKIVYDS